MMLTDEQVKEIEERITAFRHALVWLGYSERYIATMLENAKAKWTKEVQDAD